MTTKQLEDMAKERYPFIYRNNRGKLQDISGRYVSFGIPEPRPRELMKGGDFIGFDQIEITPDMVGKKIAVFTNIEIKGAGDRIRKEQYRWHNFIIYSGGKSEIWNNGEIIADPVTIDD